MQMIDMNQNEVRSAYSRFTEEERIRFLLELSHRLTVIARDAYFQGVIEKPDKLIKANEFQHRLARLALDIMDKQAVHTDDEIAEYLRAGFADVEGTEMLEEVIKPIESGQWKTVPGEK